MATYQIFVKLPDGKTQCLQFPTPTLSGVTLKNVLQHKTLIPSQIHRLTTLTSVIHDDTLLTASSSSLLFPSCNLLLRLRGGKGGFGSLLRGAATKAGQKKTSNFDACRDMNGRRLRHVNAEKRLEEWKNEEELRRLEKNAEEFLKKKAKEVKKKKGKGKGDIDKYVEKYKEESDRCMEGVEESVKMSFRLYEEKTRKRRAFPTLGLKGKRYKAWLGKKVVEGGESSDSDDDSDNEDDESVVLNVENHEGDEGSSGSVSASQSDKESGQSNLEEGNNGLYDHNVSLEKGHGSGSGNSSDDSAEPECAVQGETSGPNLPISAEPECTVHPENPIILNDEKIGIQAMLGSSSEKGMTNDEANHAVETTVASPGSVLHAEIASQSTPVTDSKEPLNFNDFSSASELEVLGMERLKIELQTKGLKCGGALHERAGRLFLLKTTPLEKLPKKLLAKKPSGGK